ncbi:MAG: hypothetical protein AAF371_12895 [Pseudomonadota bacterium]
MPVVMALALLAGAEEARAFTYTFVGATLSNGSTLAADSVTFPIGYFDSTTSSLDTDFTITVGIDQTSMFANEMVISVANAVDTLNQGVPTTGNLDFGTISVGQIDFESVLLHEMGHALGLGHVNLASESGLPSALQDYTATLPGANGSFDLNAGPDGIIGSADDLRGDDINTNYFRIDGVADNDPFNTLLPAVIDSSTYSIDLADLTGGDTFSANADRAVAGLLGYANTEAAMQQGSFFGEVQRMLGADDVAGLRYAQSGIDHVAGTADDYVFDLQFVGLTDDADILIDFDNTQTGFAVTGSSAFIINGDAFLSNADIFFNSGFNWAFSTVSTVVPLPASALTMLGGFGVLMGVAGRRRAMTA